MTTLPPPPPPRNPLPPPPPPPAGFKAKIGGEMHSPNEGSNVIPLHRLVISSDLSLEPQKVMGKSWSCFGITESGKSTTARRIAEEYLKVGVPFSIVDIENEYAALKELGEVVLAGPPVDYGSFEIDISLTLEKHYYEMGRRAYLERLAVVLLVGELEEDIRKAFLEAYFKGVFDAGRDPVTRAPHCVIIEEAQEYIPQVGVAKDDPLFMAIIRLAKRGRKRGIFLGIVAQRPTSVEKNVITMCQMYFCHFVTYPTDVKQYQAILGIDNLEAKLAQMKPGDLVFRFGKQIVETHCMRPRTESPSETPTAIDPSRFKPVHNIEEITHDVQEQREDTGLMTVPAEYVRGLESKVPALQNELAAARTEMAAMEARITDLESIRSAMDTSDAAGLAVQLRDAERRAANAESRASKAEAESLPIRLLLDTLRRQL